MEGDGRKELKLRHMILFFPDYKKDFLGVVIRLVKGDIEMAGPDKA